jgi:hypothetical protein
MEIVINIVAAEEGEFMSVAESRFPLNEWSGFAAPGLDTIKVATLHSLVTGDSLQLSLDLYDAVFLNDDETGALRVAEELMAELASLDEDALESLAGELAATEEFENDSWDVDAVLVLLTDLSELAQLAESQGQILFVWISLRQD